MSSWNVRVKDLQGKEYALSVSYPAETKTIGQLKTLLREKSGIPPVQQRLVFNRQALLDNDKRLRELGITNGSSLQIIVLSGWIIKVNNQMSPGTTLQVFMEGQASELQCKKIVDIKREIVKQQPGLCSLKLHEIRLQKNLRELRDQTTLREAGIVDNDTVNLRKKYMPPWNIFVQGISGKSYTLVIYQENPEEATIAHVKKLLEDKTGLSPAEQRLCFNSKPLEDHQKLEDHNISNNSTLFLVVRLRGGSWLQGMIALLRKSPTSTINGVPDCPTFRACPHCGTLLEHTGGCNNMTCWNASCKKPFCFVCLAVPISGSSGLSCGNKCKAPAARQTSIKT